VKHSARSGRKKGKRGKTVKSGKNTAGGSVPYSISFEEKEPASTQGTRGKPPGRGEYRTHKGGKGEGITSFVPSGLSSPIGSVLLEG